MKKVIKNFAVQVQYVQYDDNSEYAIVVAPQGHILSVEEDLNGVSDVLLDIKASFEKTDENPS